MANHFIGELVRINCPDSYEHGVECRIIETDVKGRSSCGSFVGCKVNIKCSDPRYDFCVFENHELEPILPEGAQPSEFSFTELMDKLGVVVA